MKDDKGRKAGSYDVQVSHREYDNLIRSLSNLAVKGFKIFVTVLSENLTGIWVNLYAVER